ncbi:MAG: hypothetical protein RIR26_2390 [Pseudomonadota bacterium]|jgi:cardiolipin synthase
MNSAEAEQLRSFPPFGPAWAEERLFIDGDRYFLSLLEAISRARSSIFMETYIFENDILGERVLAALQAAAERGVDVRLLVDGVGSAGWISESFASKGRVGFEVRVYHPLPWQLLSPWGWSQGPAMSLVLKLFSYANSRNHRKTTLIDGTIAFLGSLNVSDVHFEEARGRSRWHDVGVSVAGDGCMSLTDAFLRAWRRGWKVGGKGQLRPALPLTSLPEKVLHSLVIRNDGRRLRHKALARRLRQIRQARHRVWIANAYFVPSGPLLRALVAAARRGVDVRLLLPASSDVSFMPWVARAFYSTLLKHGVRLFEYQPRILHAKVTLLDEHATVGSSNLNHRSLLHDLEVDVVLRDEALLQDLQKMFEQDFLQSREIQSSVSHPSSLWKNVVVRLLLYFRYVL